MNFSITAQTDQTTKFDVNHYKINETERIFITPILGENKYGLALSLSREEANELFIKLGDALEDIEYMKLANLDRLPL